MAKKIEVYIKKRLQQKKSKIIYNIEKIKKQSIIINIYT